jgi:hypothetical protein
MSCSLLFATARSLYNGIMSVPADNLKNTGARRWRGVVQVLKDGDHTGAKPERIVRGPGWKR